MDPFIGEVMRVSYLGKRGMGRDGCVCVGGRVRVRGARVRVRECQKVKDLLT